MSLKKEEILAQNTGKQRKSRATTWLTPVAMLPLFGVVAAFGFAPGTQPEHVDIRHVVEQISLPLPSAQASPDTQNYWREERIRPGDTVAAILLRLGVDDPEAVNFLLQARSVRSLYRLIPGRSIRAITTNQGRLVELSYINGDGKQLLVNRTDDGFEAAEQVPQFEPRVMQSSGTINYSLFGATDAAGLHENVAIQIAEIFSSDIDFSRDLRQGDSFTVIYEANYAEGEFIGVGRVIAAEFTNQGRSHRAVYFQDGEGRGGYYDPEGKNVRKAFLRSPLAFSRITSRYTTARFHPVLRKWRAHRGIDYGAPTGTPVRATASGSVSFAGIKGGYGKLITLRHANGYGTRYAHLSRFGQGIRNGARVEQGQIIGYVGKTGLASGPHLHYEFLVNGNQRNPLKLALPPGPPITAARRDAFDATAKPLLSRLDLLKDTNLALLD
ncbi:MAG: peptidase M23 [Betaproteobacteria bacterium SG8_40]|jgi:murein DD-endopeptidase MepM/ murein hydrolase activator NlpD|nr:MAG: peptidase M23 [Betaproteobacteria bacterium SG8_40]